MIKHKYLRRTICKLGDTFNSFPGVKSFKATLSECKIKGVCYTDYEGKAFWKNDGATAVIAFEYSDPDLVRKVANMGKVAVECRADEFDHIVIGNREGDDLVPAYIIFRLWWD